MLDEFLFRFGFILADSRRRLQKELEEYEQVLAARAPLPPLEVRLQVRQRARVVGAAPLSYYSNTYTSFSS
jgi:hypothetical protein